MTNRIYRKPRNAGFGVFLSLIATLTFAQGSETVSAADVPALESAKKASLGDASVAYRLGLAYLKSGDTAAAVSEWRRYVSLDPSSAASHTVRQHLTLLARDEAKKIAADAALQEGQLQNLVLDKSTIAVAPFRGLGTKDSVVLGKGLQAMVISDLAKVPSLKVVERNKLQALLNETKLGSSGLAGQDAVKVGRILRAESMMGGSLVDPNKNEMIVSASVVNTGKQLEVSRQDAGVDTKSFFKLQKDIVFKVLSDLKIYDVPLSVSQLETTNFDAFSAFSLGLDFLDNGKFDEARAQFQTASRIDPGFSLVREALLSVPVADLTRGQITASAEKIAAGQNSEARPVSSNTTAAATLIAQAAPSAQNELSGSQLTYASTAPITGGDGTSKLELYNSGSTKLTVGLNSGGGVVAVYGSNLNASLFGQNTTGTFSITSNAVTDVFSDGVLFMGRWAGGSRIEGIADSTTKGYVAQNRTMPGFGVPYIFGVPVSPPTSGSATYTFYHGTPSVEYSRTNSVLDSAGSTAIGAGIVSGTIGVNFGTNVWGANFAVSHNGTYNVGGSGLLSVNNLGLKELTQFRGSASGPLCSGSCAASVGGYFFGTPGSPEKVGVDYKVELNNGNNIWGGGGFQR